MFHNLFYSILELVFKYGSERVMLFIFFRLGFLSRLSDVLFEVRKNNVVLKEEQCDSLLFTIKRITLLLQSTLVRSHLL